MGWNAVAQEAEDSVAEGAVSGVALVMCNGLMHRAPQSLNRVEMRTIGWDEVKNDAAPRLIKPLPHHLGVVIAGVVEEDMDQTHRRVHCLEAGQQGDCADGVNGQHVDHPGLPGLKVDGAVDVEAVAAAGLLDGEIDLLGRPAADRADAMGRVDRISKKDCLVGVQRVQKRVVGGDEGHLLGRRQFTRDRLRLAVLQPQAVQQLDQTAPGLVAAR